MWHFMFTKGYSIRNNYLAGFIHTFNRVKLDESECSHDHPTKITQLCRFDICKKDIPQKFSEGHIQYRYGT